MKWLLNTGVMALGVLFAAVTPQQASADTFSFRRIPGAVNSVSDVAIGESQLTVDVTDAGSGRVAFTFRNSGPAASSITAIYFDDGRSSQNTDIGGGGGPYVTDTGSLETLIPTAITDSGEGVSFRAASEDKVNPTGLPGGNEATPKFIVSAGFAADSDSPTQPMGVNPTEWVQLVFTLQSGKTFQNVLDELNFALNTTSNVQDGRYTGPHLRIGIHVQGFASGGSESLINGPGGPTPPPPPAVPLPAVVWAGMALLGGTVVTRRVTGRKAE